MVEGSGGTRGFLFADLRGYTRFVEAHGDAAGAHLLERYREIVRSVIAHHDGAEIRTEGDSFYVVFGSASGAVRAGLALVEAAASASTQEPARPISVGVGIHAGESVDAAGGPVGSAVNLAARICSAARAGEVLVSDTVRGLTRTSLDATYSSRGRPRLKGIDDPIELFAVSAGRSVRRVDRRRSLRPLAGLPALTGLVVIGLLVAVAALVLRPRLGGSPTESPTIQPLRFGRVEAGEYRSNVLQPPVEIRLGNGWRMVDESPSRLVLSPEAWPEGYTASSFTLKSGQVVIGRIRTVWSSCNREATSIGDSGQDILRWLETNTWVDAGAHEPEQARDGLTAIKVEIRATTACGDAIVPLIRFAPSGQAPGAMGYPRDELRVSPGAWLDVYVIDHEPEAVAVVAVLPGAEVADFRNFAQQLVRSLAIP